MKRLFITANWKSYKTTSEAKIWLEKYKIGESDLTNKEAIVCPPFTCLPLMQEFIKENNLPIKLGSQDVSPFAEGAFTGAVNGQQVKEFADYAIIGHSERRKEFKEDDEMLAKKVQMALQFGLTPIFCVQGEDTPVPEGVTIVAYEPIWAIGTGNPDTPENAEQVSKIIKEKNNIDFILYGGSVKPDNVHTFTQMPSINGVLVGGASLDAEAFLQLIKNA